MTDRPASRNNPIIGDTPDYTLYAAACAAAFIARYHADQADWRSAADAGKISAPDPLSSNESRGLSVLVGAVVDALWFEAEGREGGAP
jgi:hypothetical protein